MSPAIAEVVAAIRFLTRIRVPDALANAGAGSSNPATGAAAFGLVGALVGLAGAVPMLLLAERAPLAAAGLGIAAMAVLSGGLHIDGLADTADALAATSAEAAERARKDPRIGAAGTGAVALVVLVDAALLAAISDASGPTLASVAFVIAASGSRAAAPLCAWVERRRASSLHGQSGLGSSFVRHASGLDAGIAVGTTAILAGVAVLRSGMPAVVVAAAAGLVAVVLVSRWLHAARGGLDGDGFGFLIELGFTTTLLAMVAEQ